MMNLIIANAAAPGGGGAFVTMLPIFAVIGIMMFMMVRSQKKQAQKRQEMLSAIRSGTQIMTVGGVYATIKEVREKSYKIEIAKDVVIEIGKNGVAAVLDAETAK